LLNKSSLADLFLVQLVVYYDKFNAYKKGDGVVLHIRKEMSDNTQDILDVPKNIQHEFAVNCSCLNSGFNEQKN
jgi:hypothetical protein